MLLRIVEHSRKIKVLCKDGTIRYVGREFLQTLLDNIATPEKITGEDGFWEVQVDSMEEYPGKTVAWITDDHILNIVANHPFKSRQKKDPGQKEDKPEVKEKLNGYLSLSDYAALHNVHPSRVRVLCRDGRIPGVVKSGVYYFIPTNAPYPHDRRYSEFKGKKQ